ncbi:MAG: hypothetical protein J0L82_18500 [Deltaproteobacteria bacterium]|nr:hypothetical protein [Deltaproteobacteria bacterium]
MIPNLEVLGSLVRDLHQSLSQLFYIMLPVAILFSVVFGFLKSGDANYPDVIKRSFVAALLLASFPEVSNVILDICDGIAGKIDNMSGLDTFMRMAQEKSLSYATSTTSLLLKFDDLFMAVLSFGSFVLLYVARYVTIALYYFYWVLLSVCAPLMILCYIFPRTAGITANLYRALIEVACWKILWAVMSAMLTSLTFGSLYRTEGGYLTLIVMNFIIALALLCTPMLMRSLIGEGVQATAHKIGGTAAMAAVMFPAKTAVVHQMSREFLSTTRGYAAHKFQSFTNKVSRPKGP